MNPKTEQQYTDKSLQILAQYKNETDFDWRDNPKNFCDWLLERRSLWSRATWRLVKSAMIYYMTHNGPIEVVHRIQLSPNHHSIATGRKTSQLKSKKVDMNDLLKIVQYLERTQKDKDELLGMWLWSGVITGVRPCEWYGSEFDWETKTLTIKSAKVNDERGCGEYRYLKFINSTDISYLNLIYKLVHDIKILAPTESEFNTLYEACRRRLYYVNKKLGHDGDHITLYSTRHQFMANAKAKNSKVEVAAMVGHRSRFTAANEYLHSKYGNPNMVYIEASSRNMSLVTDADIVFDNTKDTDKDNGKDKVIHS